MWCTKEIQISILSWKCLYPQIASVFGFCYVDFMIHLFVISNYSGLVSWRAENATSKWFCRHGERVAWSCRGINPEGAWLDLDEAFRDALLYAPTLSCFWLMGESKRMHRLCRDMAVAPFPACCVLSPCHFIWGSTVETLAHVICPIYKLIKKINSSESTWQTLWALFRFSRVLNSWSMHSCAHIAV